MSVSASMIRALLDAVERAGASRQAFLESSGLDQERLSDPSGRFDFDEYESLQRLALEATGDPALGLRIVETPSAGAFDLLAHMVPHAPTLRDAIGLCGQFGSLLVSGSHVVLEEKVDIARIRYGFRRLSPLSDRAHAEHVVVGLLRLLRVFVGHDAPILRACFEHAAPPYRSEYALFFGGLERFGQWFTGIEFSREYLDARYRHQQPRIYSALREEAYRAIGSLSNPSGHSERVREYLMTLPPARLPKMEAVAAAFVMSTRSLRRRLAEEGTSYRQLVQARLQETAVHVLRTPGKSVQDAARETGFSDAAAFDRAFKQWTGLTPTQFQSQARGEQRSQPRGVD